MNHPYYSNLLKGLFIVLLTLSFPGLKAQQKLTSGISLPNSVDYAPSVSADGNTLIFQSNRDGKFNLYLSKKNAAGEWSTPKSLDKINNFGTSSDLIGGPTISYDGNVLYYFATFKGSHGNEDIWYSVREGDDFGEPINAGPAINSKGYEGFPSISVDGNKIYFMRNNAEQKIAGAFCYSIWMSTRDVAGVWQQPERLPSPINLGCEKSPRIMSDNEMLIFASIREGGLSPNKFDLYYSRLDNAGNWGEVKPLDYINTPENELFAAVPACGDMLYYVSADVSQDTTSASKGGFLDLDLYTSAMTKETRPKPAILIKGNLIDSETGEALFGEITIVKDNNNDSRGLLVTNKGSGGFTLILTKGHTYKVGFNVPGYYPQEVDLNTSSLNQCTTTQRDIKLKRWQGYYALTTLDAASNNPMDLSIEVTQVSNNANIPVKRKSVGNHQAAVIGGEEYSVSISGGCISDTTYNFTPKIDDTSIKSIENSMAFDLGQTKLKLRVINKETREEVNNAVLLAVDAKTRKPIYRNVLKGDTTLDISCTGTYVLLGVAANHFSDRQVLEVAKSGTKGLIEMDLELTELKPGAKLVANSITFATNSAELNKSSFAEIDQVIGVLKNNAHIKIEIAAHTDDIGTPEANLKLSDARAKSVLDYMTSKGIDAKRLISKGYGESDPAVANDSAANRAQNRRVEFRIPKD